MGSLRNGSIRARIVVWGPPGAGKTTTLTFVEGKLKSNQKGPIEKISLKNPLATYEVLPVKLGDVKGVNIELDFESAPGAWEHAAARKRQLAGVDGIVFVANSSGSAMKDNQKSLAELDDALKSTGRSLVTVPVVFQWMNQKSIGSTPPDEMQAKLNKIGAQTFSIPQDDTSAILKSFASISKMAVKVVRDDYDAGKLSEGPEPMRAGAPEAANPLAALADDLATGLDDDFAERPHDTPPPQDDLDALLDSAKPAIQASKGAKKVNGNAGGKLKLLGTGEPTLSPDGTLALPLRIGGEDGSEVHVTVQVKVVIE